VTESYDWAPTGQLAAWAGMKSPGPEAGISPRAGRQAKARLTRETGPGDDPRERFTTGLDRAMREFDARIDAIMRAA